MIFKAVPRYPIGLDAKDLEGEYLVSSPCAGHRRQWVIRTSLVLILSSAALIFLVILRADQAVINSILISLAKPTAALQAEVDELGQLPATLPGDYRIPVAYANSLVREYAKHTTQPVIVAQTWLAQPVLRGNGRGVIIYENHRVHSAWLTSQEFQEMLQAQEAAIKKWDEQRRSISPELP